MAVRRSALGLSTVVLASARDAARRLGRYALGLDCVAANRRLRAYYEAAGFVHRDVAVGGAHGHCHDQEPTTLVSRYEQRLNLKPVRGRHCRLRRRACA